MIIDTFESWYEQIKENTTLPPDIQYIFTKILEIKKKDDLLPFLVKYAGKHFLHNRLGKVLNEQEVNSFAKESLVAPQNGNYVSVLKPNSSYHHLAFFSNNQVYYTISKIAASTSINNDPKHGNDLNEKTVIIHKEPYNPDKHKVINIDSIPQDNKIFEGHQQTCMYDFGAQPIDKYYL